MILLHSAPLFSNILFCLLPCSVFAQTRLPAVAHSDNHLCWQQGRLLAWSDFRAPECYGDCSHYSSLTAAATAVRIPIVNFVDGEGRANYRVSCVFRRDSSWVNPRVTAAADRVHTLAHEQLHFDTAELVARRIRRYVAERRAAGDNLFGPVVVAEIQCLLDDYAYLSELYDDDVNFHSLAVEAAAQRRWTLLVARELRALARYQSTAVTCSD